MSVMSFPSSYQERENCPRGNIPMCRSQYITTIIDIFQIPEISIKIVTTRNISSNQT